MNAVKKVLIVGGGIGGPCAAIALRRNDIEVDPVELKTPWTAYGTEHPANVGISRLALHQALSKTTIALGASVRLGLRRQQD